ncbi:protein NATD1-like [Hyalella azteca]|uniref:Protein NATD1 n=1 Tax=Hyalella azteca TaxID=294128 RepID=A0A8B7NGE1_HYAAZ|nr:protein NATD1-like [Hyalella azteca]
MLGAARTSTVHRLQRLRFSLSMQSDQQIRVQHDKQGKEFFISCETGDRAVLTYENMSEDSVDLQHTVVPESQRGKGLAKILAKEALGYFASQQKQMQLSCWYLKKYAAENPDQSYDAFIKHQK